jgi:hypothetical protein
MSKRRENAIRSLSNLYTVVIGVALSLSAVQLIEREGGVLALSLGEGLLFVALVLTLVPFYHGAMRHLDDAYLENSNAHIRDGALILDVLLLFLHGMVFVALALLLDTPNQFAWLFVALILVDVVWGAFVYFGPSTQAEGGAEGKWALINFVFIIVCGAVLYLLDIGFNPMVDGTKLSLGISSACLLRTLADYYFCWAFYFPRD